MANHRVLFAGRMKRVAVFGPALCAVLMLVACGSNGAPTTPTSNAKNRAFISNTFTGNLQIVDTQNDTTPMTAQTTNSAGQIVQGQPVTIQVATDVTFEVESPDHTVTMVYDPTQSTLYFVTNSSEAAAGDIPLPSSVSMALFSPDSSTVYTAQPRLSISGFPRAGGVQVLTRSNSTISMTYSVPSARYLALSPNGNYLLVFCDNTDAMFLINLTTPNVAPLEIYGFSRPVNAFFSSDSTTAYVLNCGPECGGTGPASVSAMNISTQTIAKTVPVGGASVGYLNGTTLYVAGSPVPPGTTSTFDAVDVGAMSRLTANSVPIGDGFHTTMALAPNNKLYIGASSCSNTSTGCLSVVDVAANTADAPLPPRGAITALMPVKDRNVIYAIEGGYLHIYDSENDQLQATQITFTGALYGIVQVDQ